MSQKYPQKYIRYLNTESILPALMANQLVNQWAKLKGSLTVIQ